MAKAPETDDQGGTSARKTEQPQGSVTSDLATRIARARKGKSAQADNTSLRTAELTRASRAFRFASEFIAAIIVGAGFGFAVDTVFGTAPWGLIVLLLVGFAAGVLNVIRAARELNGTAENGLAPDDKDDD